VTSGISVVKADGDADTDVVTAASSIADRKDTEVVVYADDTDILALLLFHRQASLSNVYFLSDAKTKCGGQKVNKCMNIGDLQHFLGVNVCSKILVLHAFGGVIQRLQYSDLGREEFYSVSLQTSQ
jgi:hypothetical protein